MLLTIFLAIVVCAAAALMMFAYAATELMRVMENEYNLTDSKLYKLFKVANWGGILYFAFIHTGICILPVVFNAGMEATGDIEASVGMTIRVLKSELIPFAIPLAAIVGGLYWLIGLII